MKYSLDKIIKENNARLASINKRFDPITGYGAPLERNLLQIPDMTIPTQYIPVEMERTQIMIELRKYGSVKDLLLSRGFEDYEMEDAINDFEELFIQVRIKYDFCFWAIWDVKIKNKRGGTNIAFRLNRAQRRLLERLEKMRIQGKPIRAIILKARQWGGSTLVQMYIAWIQLVHKEGFYSAIVAQDSTTSRKIKAMYSKMLEKYPPQHLGLDSTKPLEFAPYEGSINDSIVSQGGKPARDVVICVGTAERPNSIRGGDISCAHFSEVAFWKKTDGKSPEDIIRSVSSSILLAPYTVDVIESTANGTGNMFHQEWISAERGESNREAIFIPWFYIELYSKKFESKQEKILFAEKLLAKKDNESDTDKSESGKYYWYLWTLGATLENINWYIDKRRGFSCFADMAAEFPSDPIEAFKHSGAKVFNQYKVEALRESCMKPAYVGDIRGDKPIGKEALNGVKFVPDGSGLLKVWEEPETEFKVSDRYLVITDVGGRSAKADYSDILVIDRFPLTMGDKPTVVAEWHGHIRHDLLAWKMAQIATYYNNAKLVVESNTYETKDNDRDTEGDHTEFILNQIGKEYSNMYARKQSEQDIRDGLPTKWGFHTNTLTKVLLIDNLIKYIEDNLYIEREEEALNEYLCYEKKQNGSFGAIIGKHDDRLMTRGIGLFISSTMPMPKIIEEKKTRKKKRVASASTF